MPEGLLPYQYEVEEHFSGMTTVAGVPAVVEFCHTMGVGRLIAKHVQVPGETQG
ncbi:MAG: hypothetical protein FJY85_19265, partial [Deltaproteobacteria bacterium]|nr:hypothetical protein [Deltaproteobacteria bacterium]